MQLPAVESSVELTSIGRIVVPPNVPAGFRVFYTTMDFDGKIGEELEQIVGVPLATCHQVHGANVVYAPLECGALAPLSKRRQAAALQNCDALWSDQKNMALGIKVADCLPVSLIDPRNSIIANIHSGWRGAVQNITARTLDEINLDTPSSFAYFGPSIRVCCFEVGEEVAAQFDPRFVDRTRGAKPHVDVAAFTADVLRQRGFEDERIVDTGLCTRCVWHRHSCLCGTDKSVCPTHESPTFHSYRRDKRSGRNLAIVAQ